MSFHFCSRSWQVQDVADGTIVGLSPRDLDKDSVPVLVEDLFTLVEDSGRPNLYLDLSEIHQLASVVLGKVLVLDKKLQEHGGRLILLHVDPFVCELFQAARLTDVLDIRPAETAGSVA